MRESCLVQKSVEKGLKGWQSQVGTCGFKINTLISLRAGFICMALKGTGPKMQEEIIGVGVASGDIATTL